MTREEFQLLVTVARVAAALCPPDIQKRIEGQIRTAQAAHYAALAAEAKEQS